MKNDTFSQIISRFQIVAVDEYNETPRRIYITQSKEQIKELTKVILIDLDRQQVFDPQMIGSYAKFMCPIRYVDPKRDNIAEIQRQIEKLPNLVKINLSRIIEGKPEIRDEGYGAYYSLDEYLFENLNKKFHEKGSLDASDFFCIIIWKANRAKSKIAEKLLKKFNTLEEASRAITSTLHNENMSDYERFKYLLNIGFRLPMLSAILTVLFPDRFLIYDYRICSHPEMKEFTKLKNPINDSALYWTLYQEYIEAVMKNTPSWLTLRQKDQYLWGKSFAVQLKNDLQRNFKPIFTENLQNE